MNDKLHLECVSGPMDGHCIVLQADTEWSRVGEGSMSFCWEEELGTPQARFLRQRSGERFVWCLEAFPAPHQTILIRRGLSAPHLISEILELQPGDVVRASQSFLRVQSIE